MLKKVSDKYFKNSYLYNQRVEGGKKKKEKKNPSNLGILSCAVALEKLHKVQKGLQLPSSSAGRRHIYLHKSQTIH